MTYTATRHTTKSGKLSSTWVVADGAEFVITCTSFKSANQLLQKLNEPVQTVLSSTTQIDKRKVMAAKDIMSQFEAGTLTVYEALAMSNVKHAQHIRNLLLPQNSAELARMNYHLGVKNADLVAENFSLKNQIALSLTDTNAASLREAVSVLHQERNRFRNLWQKSELALKQSLSDKQQLSKDKEQLSKDKEQLSKQLSKLLESLGQVTSMENLTQLLSDFTVGL
ncbi:MAG: hypothetical protein ACRCZ9_02520 [Fusobacteriaceae bacterium]